MDVERLGSLQGLVLLVPLVFEDSRGFFAESYNRDRFREATGTNPEFIQDNHSRSIKGVLRGLHYQLPPMDQGKLVRVIRGRVLDVAVDIRRSSPTFGEWISMELSGQNHKQLWVPPGFAHGFLTLSDSADLLYKVTEYYSPEHDRCVRWDDPDIGIDWPDIGIAPLLSPKDSDAPVLRDAEIFE
jgi:dTDP-4-dehydrorhamnose 3,5-epimerase